MKKIVTIVASVAIMLGVAIIPLSLETAHAAPNDEVAKALCEAEDGASWDDAAKECTRPTGSQDMGGIITTIVNVLLFIVGTISVIMIIFGGVRYATSTGDKGKVDNAKNTIIYAVVGLVVSMIAFALVNWVFDALS